MFEIETPRLRLRPFAPGDLDDLARFYADPLTRRHFPDGVLNRGQTRDELDWFLAGGDPDWPGLGLGALVERSSGAMVGRAGLLGWTIEGRREVEVAYLVARERWREGFGGEIARGLVRHGLGTLGLDRLIALIRPGNVASIRTADRAGLAFERIVELDGVSCRLHAVSRWQERLAMTSEPA